MTFTELLAEVYSLTNRPDLVAETKMAVKAAPLKLHQSDFYYKDLYETGVQFTAADYNQAITYRDLLPRYRAVRYIRKSDVTGAGFDFIQPISTEVVLDRYGYQKSDVYYVAGEVIQIRSSTLLQYLLCGFYINPDITEASYSSWIALDHPYAIVYEAATTIFKGIGWDEQATVFNKLSAEQLAMIKSSNILSEGF